MNLDIEDCDEEYAEDCCEECGEKLNADGLCPSCDAAEILEKNPNAEPLK